MRILYVVKNLRVSNGISSYLMNYYREIIKDDNILCDFLIISDAGSPYYSEIEQNGGKIYIMPSFKHPIKYISFLNRLMKNEHYDILHSNVLNSNVLISLMALIYGIKVRILHSHTTSNGDTVLKKIRNIPFQILSILNSNCFFACSKLAGKNIFLGRKFDVIPNAIDLRKFQYDEKIKSKIREENRVKDDSIIIGIVARVTLQKNPYFILKIANRLKVENIRFRIWWLGSGEMQDEIINETKKMKLDEYIKYFGSIANVNEYYSAMDCFILPSLYEGLPIVGIEAQASGLKCFFSDKITEEVKLTQYTEFLPIDDETIWTEKIKKCRNTERKKICEDVDTTNYAVEKLAYALIEKYKKLILDKQ